MLPELRSRSEARSCRASSTYGTNGASWLVPPGRTSSQADSLRRPNQFLRGAGDERNAGRITDWMRPVEETLHACQEVELAGAVPEPLDRKPELLHHRQLKVRQRPFRVLEMPSALDVERAAIARHDQHR